MGMTEKQKRFCDYYIESGNATDAANRAGYSKKTAKEIGAENLTKPHLRLYIDEQLEKMHNERVADAQEVLEYLTSTMRGKTIRGVYNTEVINEEGKEITHHKRYEYTPSTEERTKAAELLGKRHALFTDKLEMDGAVDLKVVVDYGDNQTPNDS